MKKSIILLATIFLLAASALAQTKGKMDNDGKGLYVVVINPEGKYSVWPAEKDVPAGWRAEGKKCPKQECLDYIKLLKKTPELTEVPKPPERTPPAGKLPAYTSWDVPLDAQAAAALAGAIESNITDWLDRSTLKKVMDLWKVFSIGDNPEGKTMSYIVPRFDKILGAGHVSLETRFVIQMGFDQFVVFGKKGDATTFSKDLGLVESSSFLLLFKHQGAYLADFYLTWDEPNSPGNSWKKEGVAVGATGLVSPVIPKNATNIRLKIEDETGLISPSRKVIINEVIEPVTACYRVFGTTLIPGWAKCK